MAIVPAAANTPRLGDLLAWRFSVKESGAGDDTACVSGGDSGGGVFLKDEGVWKLAGVINGVDRSYALRSNTQSDIAACIYDARGLYRLTPTGSLYIAPTSKEHFPTSAFASRVSPYAPVLEQAMRRPPIWPLLYAIAGLGVLCTPPLWFLARRRKRRRAALAFPSQSDTDSTGITNAGDTPP